MSEALIIALIGTIPAILTLFGVLYSLHVALVTRAKVEKTETNTNSMIEIIRAASRKEGVAEGVAKSEENAATLARGIELGRNNQTD
jgi:hypothetical protein